METSWVMCDLASINYLPEEGSVSFGLFTQEHGKNSDIKIKCPKVLLFKISNTLNDFELPYVVDVELKQWDSEQGCKLLEKAGYGWKDYPYPEIIYHFHAEGGSVIDAFFTEKFVITKIESNVLLH